VKFFSLNLEQDIIHTGVNMRVIGVSCQFYIAVILLGLHVVSGESGQHASEF
jgi:hypothetical protein